MTRFVTPEDALVCSPIAGPDTPAAVPEVFDAFTRVVLALGGEGKLDGWKEAGSLVFAHPSAPEYEFRGIPVTKDGYTLPSIIPREWAGRVTPATAVAFLNAQVLIYDREPGWGAHSRIVSAKVVDGELETLSELPGNVPRLDPLRDAAREDDATVWPITVEYPDAWAELLTSWEHLDGYLAGPQPGAGWRDRRCQQVELSSGRWWWEIRGLRDAGDASRYRSQWREPMLVTAYLGWPAYLVAAAGVTHRCPACSRVAIEGRRYCGAPECDRARNAARARQSRARSAGHQPRKTGRQ